MTKYTKLSILSFSLILFTSLITLNVSPLQAGGCFSCLKKTADVNGDGVVDGKDLAILVNYGRATLRTIGELADAVDETSKAIKISSSFSELPKAQQEALLELLDSITQGTQVVKQGKSLAENYQEQAQALLKKVKTLWDGKDFDTSKVLGLDTHLRTLFGLINQWNGTGETNSEISLLLTALDQSKVTR
jgi:hypothetical protein